MHIVHRFNSLAVRELISLHSEIQFIWNAWHSFVSSATFLQNNLIYLVLQIYLSQIHAAEREEEETRYLLSKSNFILCYIYRKAPILFHSLQNQRPKIPLSEPRQRRLPFYILKITEPNHLVSDTILQVRLCFSEYVQSNTRLEHKTDNCLFLLCYILFYNSLLTWNWYFETYVLVKQS